MPVPSRSELVNRDALGVVSLAVLAILAIAVGAAAVDAPTRTAGSGPTVGEGSGVLPGEGRTFDLGQSLPEPADTTAFPSAVLGVLGAVVLAAFLVSLYVLRDELGLAELKTVAVLSVVFGITLTVLYVLLQLLGGSDGAENGSGAFGEGALSLGGGGGSSSLDGAARSLTVDSPLLAVAAAAVLLVAIGFLVRSGRATAEDGDDEGPSPTAGPATPNVAELGRTAGTAADRIADGASVDNEIYRAWREMTEQLPMENPRSRTPREFARAATDAGMAREDVAALTDVFRAVRYGGTDVTAEREALAVAALRRIEDDAGER